MIRHRDLDDDSAWTPRPILRSTVRPPPPPPDTDPSLLAPRDGSMASPPPPSFEELEDVDDDEGDDRVRWFSRAEILSFPAPSSTAGFEAALAAWDPDCTVRVPRVHPQERRDTPLVVVTILSLIFAAAILITTGILYLRTP